MHSHLDQLADSPARKWFVSHALCIHTKVMLSSLDHTLCLRSREAAHLAPNFAARVCQGQVLEASSPTRRSALNHVSDHAWSSGICVYAHS